MKYRLLILGLCLSLYSCAQGQNANDVARQLKRHIKVKMQFTDAQTDSTMAAEISFLRSHRQLRYNDSIPTSEKKAQLKVLRSERNARIQSAVHLSKGQYRKLFSMLPDQLIKD